MRQVSKRYRAGIRGCSAELYALRCVDLRVGVGERVGIVGSPGAGKSTLLLCASGAMRPDSGVVAWFSGCASARPRGTSIGYVPDASMHYPFLTVREVLEHHAHLRGLLPDERIARVGEALARSELGRWAGVRMGAIPGGVARRVAIAQELVGRPRLLVIDEPFAGAGTAAQSAITEMLVGLSGEGMTLLIASRDIGATARACTRVIVMSVGRLHRELDPAAHPQAGRVAEASH